MKEKTLNCVTIISRSVLIVNAIILLYLNYVIGMNYQLKILHYNRIMVNFTIIIKGNLNGLYTTLIFQKSYFNTNQTNNTIIRCRRKL